MTQTQPTTAERIQALIDEGHGWPVGKPGKTAQIIAAEIDALKAEVERLRLPAKAWEARYRWGKTVVGTEEADKALIAMEDAEDRAAAALAKPRRGKG